MNTATHTPTWAQATKTCGPGEPIPTPVARARRGGTTQPTRNPPTPHALDTEVSILMPSLEEAARNLARAEQERQALERVMRVKDDEASTAREACWNAMQRVEEAVAMLVQASLVPVPERVVKRPATQASDLLDLDDNGGH